MPQVESNQTKGDGTLLSVLVEPSWLGLVHEG